MRPSPDRPEQPNRKDLLGAPCNHRQEFADFRDTQAHQRPRDCLKVRKDPVVCLSDKGFFLFLASSG